MSAPTKWTPEQDARLAQLCAEGRSYAQIGRGMGVSRNAALGRAARTGVSNGNAPCGRKDGQPRAAKQPHGPASHWTKREPTPPSFPQPSPEPIQVNPTHIMDLRLDHCRFPLWGHQEQPSFLYCGAEIVPGFPYCPGHKRICLVPLKKRADSDSVAPDTEEKASA